MTAWGYKASVERKTPPGQMPMVLEVRTGRSHTFTALLIGLGVDELPSLVLGEVAKHCSLKSPDLKITPVVDGISTLNDWLGHDDGYLGQGIPR